MELEICDIRNGKTMESFKNIPSDSTILDIKQQFAKSRPKYYVDRQSFRADQKGRVLADTLSIGSLEAPKVYFKDLGPQVGWTTVFLTEYAGPLFIYLAFYWRPHIIYGGPLVEKSVYHPVVNIAAVCWTVHYSKRLFETVFIHRFSHNTMPIRNIFKNSSYYWGFAAFVAYYVNHPLYTPASFGWNQIYTGLGLFALSELGNLSVHIALRNLRPPGTKQRNIPRATTNPFTWLFNLVSCPNYTYEALAWIGFTIMTQTIPAGMFTFAGLYQMSVWAIGKHRNYRREFSNYPKSRKAIIPFVL